MKMGNKEKKREATAEARSEAGIALIPNGPGKWILNLVVPEGLEIRPGDVICIDNALIPFSEFDAAEASAEPEDSGGDDYDALERELEEIADLLLNNREKADPR
jgi:hypothetical protein